MTVAEQIKKYIDENGIIQSFVAERANMRTDAFSNAMNGKRKITIDEYVRICGALRQPASRFLPVDEGTARQANAS